MGTTSFLVQAEPPAGYVSIGDSASMPALNGIIGFDTTSATPPTCRRR